ncbi:unnamed protein product [Prunus armeniaca]|uniref:Stigma-specific STIG1-like protein 1 n=2 Tax=Prunus armeniaca TaxID=36596 RepID=A0A6J5X2L8_PRUAR|nr:unnamed protein product [Prunus armeniaca]
MKSLQVLFMIAMLIMPSAITLSATVPNQREAFFRPGSSTSWFLASQSSPGRGGCGQNPLACRATEGSAGPYCCSKKCVDLRTDISNCGSCGKRCISSEICCNAHCVNPMSHNQNCGKCSNHCKEGTSCDNGMCDYA